MLALEGIKILDLSWQGPGPYCTMILGDMGAEVIRITPPSSAGARQISRDIDERAAAFQSVNRNKQGLQLNLKSKEGVAIFYRLVETADIVIEGFRPGVSKRLSVDYPTLQKLNPKLIYCSISGYGQDGPYSLRSGHDVNYISTAGALDPIGEAGRKPAIPLNLLADYGGGSKDAAIGILTALLARGKTGKGQHVDISLTDSVISLMTDSILDYYFESGVCLKRGEHPLNGGFPYYNVYKTRDEKYITIGCIETWLWDKFCDAIDKKEFKPFHFQLEHYLQPPQEKEWQDILSYLSKLFLTKTRDEWYDYFVEKDIPVGKVLSLDEVFEDPQVRERKMILEIEHPRLGKIKQVGISIKLSDTPGMVRSFTPLPGQHSKIVLEKAGYSKDEIEFFCQNGIIGC
jgi:crotonobetainyl-CoA:carnitine CoA-transferase CaiB-like acyl-CoA transferase